MSTCSFIDIVGDNSTDSTTIKFFTSNTERMRIHANGNVGIGTNNATGGKLHVVGDIYSTGKILGEVGGSNLIVGGTTYQSATAPTNGMLVEGNVGIGTTSPYSKLEIKGDDYTGDPTNHVSYLLRLTQEYTQDFATSSHEGGVGMKFLLDNQNNNSWAVGEIYCYCSNNDNTEGDSSLRFRVSDQSTNGGRSESTQGANVDAMTIHHSGNVGIGTTSPGAKLHIQSNGSTSDLIISDYPDSYYHSIFTVGGQNYDVYYNSTIKTGRTTGNGGTFNINYY